MSDGRFDLPVVIDSEHLLDVMGPDDSFGGATDAVGDDPEEDDLLRRFLLAARTSIQQVPALPGVLAAPDNQAGALLLSYLAEQAKTTGSVTLRDALVAEQVVAYATFDDKDFWGWIHGAGWSWMKAKLGLTNKAPFRKIPSASTAARVPNKARIAILGDWGTGLYGAPMCATSIASEASGFDLLVHLGDVYYAGSQQEVKQRFLNHWPWRDANPSTLSRACNSNHEMYSGGAPYFDMTLPAFSQSSSVFLVENDHWLLVGLDTAYDDFQLHGDQAAWLDSLVASADGRRIILFSHHQLFSHLSSQGSALQASLPKILDSKQVAAWYWGHEHLAAMYDEHPSWGLSGRCVGHGGYPYFRIAQGQRRAVAKGNDQLIRFDATTKAPGAWILDGPNPYVDEHQEQYGPNGYMVLELVDGQLHEELRRPDGSLLWANEI
jgi:hypothetical protein